MQTTLQERNDYVLESLRQASYFMRNVARRYTADHDDLYQVAAEAALRAYDKAQQVTNPRAYLHRTIRNAVFQYVGIAGIHKQTLADHYRIASLDAPLRLDLNRSLYNLIGDATPSPKSETRDYERLYAILDTLPPIYREIICMRYGLCGYGVHRGSEITRLLGISAKTAGNRFWKAKDLLRQCPELLDLVGSQA